MGIWTYNHTEYLCHYGVKGMKWGVHRTPEQLGHRRKSTRHTVVGGHKSAPKKSVPLSITDHTDRNGRVDSRSFYDENGLKWKDIHTDDHGNRKNHNYGKNGEHVVLYWWNEDGSLKKKVHRDLFNWERKENGDIL